MVRLIDADALIEILAEMQGRCATKAALIQNSKIWQQVKNMPTVDAEPVIRCKDCVYHGEYKTCMRGDGLVVANDYDYCSNGVRKEK